MLLGHLISLPSTILDIKGHTMYLRTSSFADQSPMGILSFLWTAPVSLYSCF